MVNYQGFPGVAFIAGRTFQSEYGTHEAGTVVTQAPQFPNLDVLVSAGLLHPYSPGNGYDYLPPHLFSETNVLAEVEAFIAGDPTPDVEQYQDGIVPEVVIEAEQQAADQEQVYETIRNRSNLMREARDGDTRAQRPPEAVNRPATKKAAAKKTAAPTQKEEK